MRMILRIYIFIFIAMAGCQERDGGEPPVNIKETFTQMFKGAKAGVWKKDKKNIWKAKFSVNGIETVVKYNSDGSFKEKEEKIPVSAVPPLIYTYFNTDNGNDKIREIEKITDSLGNAYYEVGIKGKVLFNSSGQLLKEHGYK